MTLCGAGVPSNPSLAATRQVMKTSIQSEVHLPGLYHAWPTDQVQDSQAGQVQRSPEA